MAKITLKEFFESKEELGIHCTTEEQANKLLSEFNKMGKRWCDGDSYLADNCWRYGEENTVYYNNYTFGHYIAVTLYYYTVYEFEDIDWEEDNNVDYK